MYETVTVKNGSNRNWSMTEELDLSCWYSDNVEIEVNEDWAVVTRREKVNEDNTTYRVFLWAVDDNLYIAMFTKQPTKIYTTNSLRDAVDFAEEALYQ